MFVTVAGGGEDCGRGWDVIQANLGQVAHCNVGIEIYQLWIFMGKYVLLGAIGNYLVSTRRHDFRMK